MTLLAAFALILAGIVALLFGGDFLIRGATSLAKKWNVPSLLIGLTIVAFGTSAPELVVSIDASLSGYPGLAVGNIVGSNIANVLFVLGLPAIFGAIATNAPGVKRNAVFALLASGALIWAAWDGGIQLWEGSVLVALIILFVGYMGVLARRKPDDPLIAELIEADDGPGLPKSGAAIALFLIAGLIALPLGAHMIVSGGTRAAELLGVPDAVIGLTAVAIGTSLPELAAVMVAVMRRNAELAIGNVLGSNIFNVFAVGGGASLAVGLTGGTLAVPEQIMTFDVWVMLAAAVILALWVFAGRSVGRLTGLVFFAGYCTYVGALAVMNPISLDPAVVTEPAPADEAAE